MGSFKRGGQTRHVDYSAFIVCYLKAGLLLNNWTAKPGLPFSPKGGVLDYA